jgi:hypothetical protein
MRIVCVTRRRLALSLLYSEYLSARKHGAGRVRRALSVSDEEKARPDVNDLANRTY